MFSPYCYNAVIMRVLDGDSMVVYVDRGCKDYSTKTLRIKDLDTPETTRRWRHGKKVSVAEVTAGKAAKKLAMELLQGQCVRIQTYKDPTGKYGRLLVDMWYKKDGEWIDWASMMKAQGFDRNNNPL